MARNSFASMNTEIQSPVSLQNAVAHMISNPYAFITSESLAVTSFDQTSWRNNSQAPEPHGRSESHGQQLQGGNDTENLPSYNDNQRHGSYESRVTQSQQHLPEGHGQIRNELVEIDIPLVADNDLHTDSMENPSNSDVGFSLPTISNFVAESFRLPAGRRVRSPQYITYKERLGTFKNWPVHLTQRPKELTQAGFYFLGTADVVRCFACDGGLKNWEPEDDPWIEHARWFSSCDYLRHVKGEEFIQLVRLMDEDSTEEDENPAAVNDEEQATRYMQALNLDDSQGKTETSVLDADCAQSVIQTGFSDMAVVRGINDLLSKGQEEYGALDILNVILAKEEEENVSSVGKHSNTCRNEAEISGCIPDAATSMVKENEALKRQMMCMECEERERNILFLPCKHRTVCEKCSPKIHVCFTCFRRVSQKVKTYMS